MNRSGLSIEIPCNDEGFTFAGHSQCKESQFPKRGQSEGGVYSMGYKFFSVERNTRSGNNAETCALLHLMCYADEHDEIEQFAIDCFNDVTGMDSSCFSLHDVQSKAGKKVTPAELGKDLATLFENAVSDFSQYFMSFTLFVGGVSPSVLIDSNLKLFHFHDMKTKAQESVRKHLVEACSTRHDGNFKHKVTDDSIDDFLHNKVRFAIAKDDPSDYIRALACDSSELFPSERKLQQIFSEIRNMQSNLKNLPSIADEVINRPDEVLDFGRALQAKDIRLLVIQRLLNRNFFEDEVPSDFQDYLKTLPPEKYERDVIEESQAGLFRQYLDKNNRKTFWRLLEKIVAALDNDRSIGIEELYKRIDIDTLRACAYMNKYSHLFFISIVKDGLRK